MGTEPFRWKIPQRFLRCWVITMLFNAAQICLLPWQFAGCWRYLWWLEGTHSCICCHVLKITQRDRYWVYRHSSKSFLQIQFMLRKSSRGSRGSRETLSMLAKCFFTLYVLLSQGCIFPSFWKETFYSKSPEEFRASWWQWYRGQWAVQRCPTCLLKLTIREPLAISPSYHGVICFNHALKLIEAEESYFKPLHTRKGLISDADYGDLRHAPRDLRRSGKRLASHRSKGLGCHIRVWRPSDDRGLRMGSRWSTQINDSFINCPYQPLADSRVRLLAKPFAVVG